MTLPISGEPWTTVLLKVCRCLGPLQASVLVGGSCGLVLQGVEIGKVPRDIDMYYDRPVGSLVRSALFPFEHMAPHESETERYRSILSHYVMDGITVELVGDFLVRDQGSLYGVEVENWARRFGPWVSVGGGDIRVMPLAHEFVFNLLRERHDRIEAIVKVMRENPTYHQHILRDLLRRQKISEELVASMENWLGFELGLGKEGYKNGAY